jgi:hypothetical protein
MTIPAILHLLTPSRRPLSVAVASSAYRVTVPEESVMAGNAALLKCSIPSFVADFLHVVGWIDSEGVELAGGGDQALGNSHHTPCLLPFSPLFCIEILFFLSVTEIKKTFSSHYCAFRHIFQTC